MDQNKKKILFKDELDLKLKKGIDTLANAVKTTMGPKGKLVLIQRENKHPTITKDGVTVAQAVNLVDEVENLGVKVIKEAAARTADEAGDGTTTSTVLAQSIYNEGLKMKSAGYQIDLLKEGIELALKEIKKNLFLNKKNISCKEELEQVAMISANGEKEIANLIVNAIDIAGPHGSIIVEEAKGFKSDLTSVDGFKLERGFLSPYFVTDKNKMNCEFSKPLVLILDKDINSIHDLMKPLELALSASKPILVVANEISNEALQGLVMNKTKGSLRICAIKSPGFGNIRHEMLDDLQAITGGTVITDSFDMSSFTEADFGTCSKAIIQKSSTMLISDKKENTDIQKRIEGITERLKTGYDLLENEIKALNYRLQQLSGGIAILRVGASTESELIERYDRVDDALNATKAAIEEGILPGGGTALAKTVDMLKSFSESQQDSDVKAGIEIMMRAVVAPFKQIISNGSKSPETLLNKIIQSKKYDGYDARNNIFGNMYELGIVDPHKVIRIALENAVSAACMLLCVDCCMINSDVANN